MQTLYEGHSVLLFPGTVGGWYFAEVDGESVWRFGPFESHHAVDELVSVLFPELPRVELSDSSDSLDDTALMILGNAVEMANGFGASARQDVSNGTPRHLRVS